MSRAATFGGLASAVSSSAPAAPADVAARGAAWPSVGCAACGVGEAGAGAPAASAPSAGRWLRLGVAAVVVGQAMVLSLALNIAEPRPVPGDGLYAVLHGLLVASALVPLGLLGGRLATSLWVALRARRVTIEALFALSLVGALGASLLATFTGTGGIFYEVVGIVLLIYTLGRWASERQALAARTAANELRETFATAWVVRPGSATRVRLPVAELDSPTARDFLVEVQPGEPLAVDGRVVEGPAQLREAMLTGEPGPVPRGPGDRVWAGTWVEAGRLRVQPTARLGERRVDELLAAVEGARLAPSQLQAQAEVLLRRFVPVVAAIAVATLGGWLAAGVPWSTALFHAMSVLLVACPCALGLATPLAVWTTLARWSTQGLLARGGPLVDALARVDTIAFDKTGTLTADMLPVRAWAWSAAFAGRADELRALVAAAEAGLPHPVARALAAEAPGAALPAGARVEVVPGQGIVVHGLGEAARPLRIGARALHPATAELDLDELGRGPSGRRVELSCGEAAVAVVTLDEPLRPGMADLLRDLRARGAAVEIWSGDPAPWAATIGGVAVQGGLSPLEKRARLRAARAEGRTVLYIGDGHNDAPTLAEADAGLAVGEGTALARAAALGVLPAAALGQLPRWLDEARALRRRLAFNYRFALAYNAVGIAWAASGTLHPVGAALLMAISSAFVAAQALRPLVPSPGRWFGAAQN